MLARVLELWDRCPDAAQRIGAGHGRTRRGGWSAELAGEDERGLGLVTAPCRDRRRGRTGPGRADAAPRGRLKHRLGRADYADRPAGGGLPGAGGPFEPGAGPGARGGWPTTRCACTAAGRARAAVGRRTGGGIARRGERATEVVALNTWPRRADRPRNGERSAALLAEARMIATRARALQPLRAPPSESHMLEARACMSGRPRWPARASRWPGSTAWPATYGAVLANNLAEPLLALGRWDEARRGDRARAASSPRRRLTGACMWRWPATWPWPRRPARRGRIGRAIRSALDDARYQDQYHLPLAGGDRAAAGAGRAGRGPGRGRGRLIASTCRAAPGTPGRCWSPASGRVPPRRPGATRRSRREPRRSAIVSPPKRAT